MVRSQHPLEVRGQRLADRDGERHAVAQLDQVMQDGGGRLARVREAPPPGQPGADHPRHQAVHADGLAVQTEAQQ